MENNKDTAIEAIVRRLELVETRHVASLQEACALRKANRRITWVAVALGAMLVLVLGLAAAKTDGGDKSPPYKSESGVADVIRAKKLEIVDDKGIARMAMDFGRQAEPRFVMNDEKGKTRVGLYADADGPALGMFDDRGNARATIRVTANTVIFALRDQKGKDRAALSVFADGPDLELLDKDGTKIIWQAPPTKSGLPPVAPK